MREEDNKSRQSERSRYRSSFGATLLFSGVQVYQILIRIVKSKFVALFIGPVGMGIQSLLHSTTDTISAATNLGLNTSSVKTISSANRNGDRDLIARNVTAQRRLIWITGLIGTLICAVLAPIWSQTSFGNSDYIFAFVIVSTAVLLDQLNKGELALLQGLQQKKQLARANIIGQTLNAIVTIPLYFFFGVKAIPAVLVLGSFISLIISRCYSRRLAVLKVRMSWKETFSIGNEMIKLGFFLSLQFFLSQLSSFIIRVLISKWGSLDDVGLFGAGMSMVDVYLGLVFTAMATDYFPRLAATSSLKEMNNAVKNQSEISMLLVAPIVVAFVVFIKPIIVLLYSDKFLPIEGMMYAAMGATIIKALGWSLSYTVLAKGKPLSFFLNELVSMVYSVPIKIIAYKYWGLTGFGCAIIVCYILYLIQLIIVTRKLFDTRISKSEWIVCFVTCALILLTLAAKNYCTDNLGYIFGVVLLIVTIIYSFKELNRRMDLVDYFKKKFSKQ